MRLGNGLTATHIAQLELVDHQLMRTILSAHSKIPTEFLYLETGALPVKYVISSRRLNYLKHIHMQSNHELVKRVFLAQKDDPKKGDWCQVVQSDLETYDINENELKLNSKNGAKKYIKGKIYEKAFENLKYSQSQHSKVKDIKYEEYTCQSYMKSKQFSFEESSLLVALLGQKRCQISSPTSNHSVKMTICALSVSKVKIHKCTVLNVQD